MRVPSVLIALATLASAVPFPTSAESAAVYDNRTVTCGSAFFGGCCHRALDSYSYSSSCFNATLVATDVGGSTFGPVSKYACVNKVPASDIYSALCCKFQTVRMNATSNWTFMSCPTSMGDPQ